MDVQIRSKDNRGKTMRNVVRSNKSILRKTSVLEPVLKSPLRGTVSLAEKERLYFEYTIENEPHLQDDLGILIDGDAFPIDYSGNSAEHHLNSSHIQWGRVIRNISQNISFERVERNSVEASIITTLDGALKISAPYHLSRRKRHAVLFKPFQESCTRKAYFERVGNSADVAKAWKLVAISAGKGGTEGVDVEIESLKVVRHEQDGEEIVSPLDFRISLNGHGMGTTDVIVQKNIDLELKVRSKEMEQNMVVVRSFASEKSSVRTQFQYLSDVREDCEYCQTYAGRFAATNESGIQQVVVEAVLRSSLYDPGAPVSTSFWVFPLTIQ